MDKKIILSIFIAGLILIFSGSSIVGSLPKGTHFSMEIQHWKSHPKNNNDTTPPVTNITLNGTVSEHGVFSSDVEVTLNAIDDLSGVNVTYYELDMGGDKKYIEPFMVTGHNLHILVYRSIDNAGNEEDWKEKYIDIDLKPPIIVLSFEILNNKSVRFTPETYDLGSGIYKVEYYIDDEYEHTVYNSFDFNWIWTPPEPGHYIVSSIAYDKADNTGLDVISVDVPRNRIDTNQWFLRFLEQFPMMERILNILM